MRCDTCRFWRILGSGGVVGDPHHPGECLLYPPQANRGFIFTTYTRPHTVGSDFRGQWQPISRRRPDEDHSKE